MVCMLVRRWGNHNSPSSLKPQFPPSVRFLSSGIMVPFIFVYTSILRESVGFSIPTFAINSYNPQYQNDHARATRENRCTSSTLPDDLFNLAASDQPFSMTSDALAGTTTSDGPISSLRLTPLKPQVMSLLQSCFVPCCTEPESSFNGNPLSCSASALADHTYQAQIR